MSVNGGSAISESVNSGSWNSVSTFTKEVILSNGSNSIRFFNDNGSGPDIDKIVVSIGEGGVDPGPIDPPSPPSTGNSFVAKRKVIVETDLGGDRDDQSSLIRWLLYTNEWDVQGIIFDRANNRFQNDGAASNPTGANSTMEMASDYLDAYDDVRSKLIQHDADYPTRSYLWSKSVHGTNGSSAGVNLIINAVDNTTEDDPIWYHNWGSNSGTTSNLRRAFDKIEDERSNSAYEAFVRKVKIVTLDGKNDTKQRHNDKVTLHVETGYKQLGSSSETRWYRRFDNITAGFISENNDIKNNHGNLGKLYVGQKEGDSWTFIYMIPTGLSDPYEPTMGGWAGRYGVRDGGNVPRRIPFYWANQEDNWNGSTNRDNTAARFARALQNDFKARLDWCVRNFSDANHEPEVVVQGDNTQAVLYVDASAGSTISLSAAGTSDPDGDNLSYTWWRYQEADSYSGNVTVSNNSSQISTINIPSNASGRNIHIICEVRDNGSPNLTRYRRVVINVSSGSREINDKASDIAEISLYPNPVDALASFHLSFGELIGQKLIQIVNSSGKTIARFETEKTSLEVSNNGNLPTGLYAISIQHEGKQIVKKLLIQ